jgi:outer membrane protein TolC
MRSVAQALLVSLFVAVLPMGSALGLTMDEAVDTALENNHRIKQFGHLESSSRAEVGSARAGFFPALDLSYSYTESTEDVFLTDNKSSVFTAQAAYNLFNGFSDLKGLGQAKSAATASRYRKMSVIADVVLTVKTAYTEVLRAARAEETARESVELLERQGRDAALFFREGLIAKNELLKVQVELASARQELLQAEGNRRIALRRLERALGVGLSPEEEILDISGRPRVDELSFEALKDEMLSRRSELMYLRAMRDSHRYGMQSVRGGYLPRVDVVFSYNRYLETQDTGPLFSSYESDTRGMLTARCNLFDGLRTTDGAGRFKYLMEAAEEELRDTEQELLFQLREALEGYVISEGKLGVADKAVDQAEENYRVTRSQFRERVATTTDLLDARSFLTRARNQYNNALYDLHLAAARIERVVERGAGND